MTSKRVLFVDDEPNILQGLQRMLRGMRHDWEMHFASGGQGALALLAEQPFDVVVSDMRMPVMDGAQLLNEVKRLYPNIIRIVLSGHADRELIMSSLGATHQYLSKPCSAETLKAAVERAFSLNALFEEEPSIKPLISRIHTLPSVPALYLQIMDELRSPDATVEQVGSIIARDPAMTAKILQIVNSAFFGQAGPVSSAEYAVELLGLDTVRTLVLSAHLFKQLDNQPQQSETLDQLWRHGTVVGQFAAAIAQAERASEEVCGNAMIAGTLHDIGQLLLLTNLPGEYLPLMTMVEKEGADLFEMERMYFGASHTEIGAYLLGLWGLPAAIVEAVVHHHSLDGLPAGQFCEAVAVYVANALSHELLDGGPTAEEALELTALGGLAQRLPAWRRACLQILAQTQNKPASGMLSVQPALTGTL